MATLIKLSHFDYIPHLESAEVIEPDFDDADLELMEVAQYWSTHQEAEAA